MLVRGIHMPAPAAAPLGAAAAVAAKAKGGPSGGRPALDLELLATAPAAAPAPATNMGFFTAHWAGEKGCAAAKVNGWGWRGWGEGMAKT